MANEPAARRIRKSRVPITADARQPFQPHPRYRRRHRQPQNHAGRGHPQQIGQ